MGAATSSQAHIRTRSRAGGHTPKDTRTFMILFRFFGTTNGPLQGHTSMRRRASAAAVVLIYSE